MMLLLFSYMESEHNFMDPYSQDDLISSARNVSIHMYYVHMLGVENVLRTGSNYTYMHTFIISKYIHTYITNTSWSKALKYTCQFKDMH